MDRKTLESIDKPFGELDEVTQWALRGSLSDLGELLSKMQGKENWCLDRCFVFEDHRIYRVAPEPVTYDSVDWSHVAKGWSYMARDENGGVWMYDIEPEDDQRARKWLFSGEDTLRIDGLLASYTQGTCDWTDSLVVRPGCEEDV